MIFSVATKSPVGYCNEDALILMKVLSMDIVNAAVIIQAVTLIMLLNEALAGKKIQ